MVGSKPEPIIFFPKPSSLVFLVLTNATTILSVTQAGHLGFPYLPILLQSLSYMDIIIISLNLFYLFIFGCIGSSLLRLGFL